MGDDKDDIERELAEHDGMRPDEEEGPGESDASPMRCQFKQGERMGGPEDSSFEVTDELHESFPVEPIPVVMGADGLPEIVTPNPEDAQAVPFTYETQLCIEDDRVYVELFHEEALPDTRAPYACRNRYDKDGNENERERFEPEQVVRRWGRDFVEHDGGLIPVRPLRLRCKHYKRQVFSNDSQPDRNLPMHEIVFRVCTARRSNGGAFMSLNNEGIYVCDFRDPPDPNAAAYQDALDKKKLVERPDKIKLPLFNMPGDAVEEDDDKQLENNT